MHGGVLEPLLVGTTHVAMKMVPISTGYASPGLSRP